MTSSLRLPTITLLCFFTLLIASSNAFAPSSSSSQMAIDRKITSSTIHMGFGMPDEETKKLTRENEPDQYFATNMDKMSDQEKLPVAIAGLAFISLPFIAGLIALYASK